MNRLLLACGRGHRRHQRRAQAPVASSRAAGWRARPAARSSTSRCPTWSATRWTTSPTSPCRDRSTFAAAQAVCDRYDLWDAAAARGGRSPAPRRPGAGDLSQLGGVTSFVARRRAHDVRGRGARGRGAAATGPGCSASTSRARAPTPVAGSRLRSPARKPAPHWSPAARPPRRWPPAGAHAIDRAPPLAARARRARWPRRGARSIRAGHGRLPPLSRFGRQRRADRRRRRRSSTTRPRQRWPRPASAWRRPLPTTPRARRSTAAGDRGHHGSDRHQRQRSQDRSRGRLRTAPAGRTCRLRASLRPSARRAAGAAAVLESTP